MRVFISLIFILFFYPAPQLSAENNNRVVAFVNDDVITLYELNNKIEEVTGKTSDEMKSENEQQFFKTRDEILDLLIEDTLAKQKIKELDLETTQEEVDSYLEMLKKNNKITQEELIAQLKREGMSYDKFREKIKEEMERRNLIDREVRSKVIISTEEIAQYYESHKKDFEKPGEVHIASIFLVPDSPEDPSQLDNLQEKGKKILSRLEKGEEFGVLAREFSNGPGAAEGGDLGNIRISDVDPKIMEIIKSLKDGETSSLINMGNRIQIIKLIKKFETEWVPLEEAEESIYEKIYDTEMEKRYNDFMALLKKNCYMKKIL